MPDSTIRPDRCDRFMEYRYISACIPCTAASGIRYWTVVGDELGAVEDADRFLRARISRDAAAQPTRGHGA